MMTDVMSQLLRVDMHTLLTNKYKSRSINAFEASTWVISFAMKYIQYKLVRVLNNEFDNENQVN